MRPLTGPHLPAAGMRDPALWGVLRDYPFALEGKVPTLLRVLLRKSTLGQSRAKRALDEYRRFLYLAALEGAKVAPPPLIQAIWRAHAGNWRGYHQNLCQTVLRRPLPELFDAPVSLSDPDPRRNAHCLPAGIQG